MLTPVLTHRFVNLPFYLFQPSLGPSSYTALRSNTSEMQLLALFVASNNLQSILARVLEKELKSEVSRVSINCYLDVHF